MPKKYPIQIVGFPLFYSDQSTNIVSAGNGIRVADVWTYLGYTIRNTKKVGTTAFHKADQQFLLDLLEQAEYFYKTAEQAPLKSQPLLYYYSFMNLAKILINLSTYRGNAVKYIHGIGDTISRTSKLTTAEIKLGKSSGVRMSVSELLIEALGDKQLTYIGNPLCCTIKVMDLLRDCIGVRRSYREINKTNAVFYRIRDIETYSQSRNLYFQAKIDDCDAALMGRLIAKGYHVIQSGNDFVLTESVSVKTTANPTIAEKERLAKKLRNLGVWAYNDGKSYKLYISDEADIMSSASVIYHIMFFFSSITRYHPDLFDEIISAKDSWVVGEFLKTQPIQFVYYVISRVAKAEVLIREH